MTPEEWLAASYKRADDLLAIENASSAVGDAISAEITAIAREVTRRYVLAFGSTYARKIDAAKLAPILAYAAKRIAAIDPGYVEKEILATARKAYLHGVIGAYVGLRKVPPQPRAVRLSNDVKDAAKTAVRTAEERLSEARSLVEGAERYGDLTLSLAKAKQAATYARGTAAFATNRSASDGRGVVARKEKSRRVWVAERDACVHCAAYSGTIVGPNGLYPGGLTYGKKPISLDPLASPPLHGHCRCHEELIGPTGGDDFAEALRREAARSVARGFSLESESTKTRLEAVTRLLATNPKLPKSVLDYARRSLKKGEFPRGRTSPVGTKANE